MGCAIEQAAQDNRVAGVEPKVPSPCRDREFWRDRLSQLWQHHHICAHLLTKWQHQADGISMSAG